MTSKPPAPSGPRPRKNWLWLAGAVVLAGSLLLNWSRDSLASRALHLGGIALAAGLLARSVRKRSFPAA